MSQPTEARLVSYELEITINAPRNAVWSALTEQIQSWWLPDFHMVDADSVIEFDARAGGQLLETHPDGGGLLWYTVCMSKPGESVHMAGQIFPEWGGPATSMLQLSLSDSGPDTTRLAIRDAHVGHVSDSNLQSLKDGWTELFTKGLKRHVES